MKYRYLKKAILYSLLAIVLSSCFDDNVTVYDGPLLVEFSNLSGNPTVNYSWNSTGRFWATEIRAAAIADTAIQVQLIGPHQKAPLKIGYYIAPEVFRNTISNRLEVNQPAGVEGIDWVKLTTTAIAGTDYNLLDGGEITIPAKSSYGKLRLSTSPTGDRYMYIVLTEMDIKPNVNANIFRLRIRP